MTRRHGPRRSRHAEPAHPDLDHRLLRRPRVGIWGWLATITGIIWIAAAVGLWALQPWARWFAMFMSGLALFEAALAFFQFTGSGIGFGMAIMPIIILLYLNTSEVRAEFEDRAPTGI